MSFLGLDVGDKKIGVAISHSEVLANEYATLENNPEIFEQISKICQSENMEKIVVGLPISASGEDSAQAKKTRQFAKNLQGKIDLPVILENETLTTMEAEQILCDEGLTVAQAKERVDQLSAKLILQQFLESQQEQKNRDLEEKI
ncbi:MAG: Holliday junction resolvase RuvX [Candidatus Nealsonbacteria bacterium CG23_combo_of_CG06-09_8_20_14_all_40_13]|uniref:Putative pre-16S rRNA nuclease n=1 Tax=Candidatus Nealsonbacteria bacterium CG23_combo_of_CG06-09_8_20_14_all_40_13 TaxID=1974724 RepID=A0A2G9YQQ3_9BACT|nr:MAG: Holliday junction resolvase RuvX [Candidatus Nealsonbacteria bacterium CG23_combo_of_CG06-09_8_20_14_all_40_13]PIR70965.1 MAG: Holliday junction resolvase RuvX [Candidatus Nealsonbacteria bacterium CG10_big_fil_rev_8_21_14_0_10_40_24]PIU43297.1 MAG: Holliday junction resolvase RuvX [Candidatus Nealsonbacteria bacterium CG07_land_8_20_14_0_80_40_10]